MKRGWAKLRVNSASFMTRREGTASVLRQGAEDPFEPFPFLLVSLDLNFSEPSFPALPLNAELDPG